MVAAGWKPRLSQLMYLAWGGLQHRVSTRALCSGVVRSAPRGRCCNRPQSRPAARKLVTVSPPTIT